MSYPAGFKFTKEHVWIELTEDRAKVGITDYAQQQLGDVVYLELPDVGVTLKQGQSMGTIESVKTVSELYAPVSGEVAEVNAAAKEKSEKINSNPYDTWLVVLKVSNVGEVNGLLDATQYADLVK